jgi:hypothetical protein
LEFVDSSGAAVTQVADGVVDLRTPRSRVATLPLVARRAADNADADRILGIEFA